MKAKKHSAASLLLLPSDVYSVISTFVSISNLFSLSKEFVKLRYEHGYIKLDPTESLLYCEDANFRSKIKSLVHYPNTQVSLNCNSIDITDQKLKSINAVHSICLSFSKVVSWNCLTNIQTVDLSFSTIEDVAVLKNVKNLNLSHCSRVQDVSSLRNVQKLQLSHCENVYNVNGLDNVTELYINGYSGITDVSGLLKLQRIHVSLKQSANLKGITKLQQQYKVQIVYYC